MLAVAEVARELVVKYRSDNPPNILVHSLVERAQQMSPEDTFAQDIIIAQGLLHEKRQHPQTSFETLLRHDKHAIIQKGEHEVWNNRKASPQPALTRLLRR